MHAAKGILTARGGMTSHAAVVARGMGRPCVSGAGGLSIDAKNSVLNVGGRRLVEGDVITIDGASGEVMAGEVPTVQPELARSEEHTSELPSLMRISYAFFCLEKKRHAQPSEIDTTHYCKPVTHPD